jgi:NADP-dependent 3-hydroxy acid dehydrogenase YdfG
MVDINIKGVLYGIAAALPIFIRQNSGQVINSSSIAGVKVFRARRDGLFGNQVRSSRYL